MLPALFNYIHKIFFEKVNKEINCDSGVAVSSKQRNHEAHDRFMRSFVVLFEAVYRQSNAKWYH